jgi:hypothetical protein
LADLAEVAGGDQRHAEVPLVDAGDGSGVKGVAQ